MLQDIKVNPERAILTATLSSKAADYLCILYGGMGKEGITSSHDPINSTVFTGHDLTSLVLWYLFQPRAHE